MKLSVIMPAYNSRDTVSQAIESILNQSFTDFEFIIVNDGSTDGSEEIIGNYQKKDNRINLINQKNLGVTKSLNVAIGKARGDYIARQDADDISLRDRLRLQVEFLDKNEELGFTGCSCEIIDKSGEFLNFVYIGNNPSKNILRLRRNNIYCHGSMMFRSYLLKKISGYREFFKYAQDYDLYLRLIELTLPGSVREILYRKKATLLESISIENVRLQAAYADLAKRCYETRILKQNDEFILKESFLNDPEGITSPTVYDFIPLYMKSLDHVKNADTKSARLLIRPYLFPLNKNKFNLYRLWFFSYFPSFLINSILSVKKNLRKIKMGCLCLKRM